jgi:hypothetical protein
MCVETPKLFVINFVAIKTTVAVQAKKIGNVSTPTRSKN